ncbi:MAG: HPP family protein [Pseudomonas sp.]|nr:HPP family protein [Pseudomonas sp.]
MGQRWLSRCLHFIGWRPDSTSHQEKFLSALGATLSLLLVYWITHIGVAGDGALWVTGSMGASAVLVFAMPHGTLSQPWSVIGGQVISATFGVACVTWLPAGPWVAALAVGGSIMLMMYARCLHPPGGATAMIVVLGGPAVEQAGFSFVLYPILLDALVIVGAAILFNSLFDWRRYPLALARAEPGKLTGIAPEDFHHALREMNSYVDIQFDDLLKLVELANSHAKSKRVDEEDLKVGGFYSNGLPGKNWSVREVVQIVARRPGRPGRVRYRTIKGMGEGGTGITRLSEFVRWARYAVEQDETGWHRLHDGDAGKKV